MTSQQFVIPTQTARLAQLKEQRSALDAEIKLIEKGFEKAAYDACMTEQYLNHNARRLDEGKRQLSAGEYAAGVFDEDTNHED